jgi:hypothetical protein
LVGRQKLFVIGFKVAANSEEAVLRTVLFLKLDLFLIGSLKVDFNPGIVVVNGKLRKIEIWRKFGPALFVEASYRSKDAGLSSIILTDEQ